MQICLRFIGFRVQCTETAVHLDIVGPYHTAWQCLPVPLGLLLPVNTHRGLASTTWPGRRHGIRVVCPAAAAGPAAGTRYSCP